MKQPTLPSTIEKAFDNLTFVEKNILSIEGRGQLKQWFAQTLQAEVQKAVEAEKKRLVSRKLYRCDKCLKYQEGKLVHHEGSQRESSVSCEVCDSCIFIYQSKEESS